MSTWARREDGSQSSSERWDHVVNFTIILFCLSGRSGKAFGGLAVLPQRGATEGLVNAVVVVVAYPPGDGGLQFVEVVVGGEVD